MNKLNFFILCAFIALFVSCFKCKSLGTDCDAWEDSYIFLLADGKEKEYSCLLISNNIVKYNENYINYGTNSTLSDCVIGELTDSQSEEIEY